MNLTIASKQLQALKNALFQHQVIAIVYDYYDKSLLLLIDNSTDAYKIDAEGNITLQDFRRKL